MGLRGGGPGRKADPPGARAGVSIHRWRTVLFRGTRHRHADTVPEDR